MYVGNCNEKRDLKKNESHVSVFALEHIVVVSKSYQRLSIFKVTLCLIIE